MSASDGEEKLTELQRAVAYYRKQTDELAGENLRLDYTISGLKHELKQKRQGFSLLSSLQQSIGSQHEVNAILGLIVQAVNGTLGMDKTVVFQRNEAGAKFAPAHWLGLGETEPVESIELEFPESVVDAGEILVFNGQSVRTSLAETISKALSLPYFLVVGLRAEGKNVGVLVSGRTREAKPLYPPLDQGDVDTFRSISGLFGATIESIKVAALTETDRLKTEFFANISHEFRTPITLTLGPLESLLSGRHGPLTEKVKREIEMMLRNQRRLLNLINQILDLAKLESKQVSLSLMKVTDFNELVRRSSEVFESLAQKRGFELRTLLDPSVSSAEIYVDLDGFEKILHNLMSNACKFTKRGFVEIATKLDGEKVLLSVKDSGTGIRKDQITKVFDRFKQADGSESESREFAGTGIGLSLVKQLVDLHQGTIEVESEYGKGTTFTVSLQTGRRHFSREISIAEPITRQDFPPRGDKPSDFSDDVREGVATSDQLDEVQAINDKSKLDYKPKSPTVLYVDDNHDLRIYVHGLLSDRYNVLLGVDGRDGLRIVSENKIDLILSDLMMPIMTGSQFLAKVRGDPSLASIPFVLLTAKSAIHSKVEQLEKGADDYLSKPFSEAELLARIANLLALRAHQQRIKRELQAARHIQQSLLPPSKMQVGRIGFSSFYRPCEELSGDFLDIIPVGDWAYFYVTDVMSHGAASAQITYMIKTIFGDLLRDRGPESLDRLAEKAFRRFLAYELDYSVGVTLGRVNVKDGQLEIWASNAPNPILISGGTVSEIEYDAGPTFYFLPGMDINRDGEFDPDAVQKTILAPGSRVLFLTDGCFEFASQDGNYFDYRRLLRMIRALADANEFPRDLVTALEGIRGGTHFPDDLSILCLEID